METIESQVRSSQPLRNIQLLEKLLAPGYSEVIASMVRLEQELRVVCQRVGNDVQELWKSIRMVCIPKICPKILRDHLAVQASSIDSPEKQTDAREIPASECAWTWGEAHGR